MKSAENNGQCLAIDNHCRLDFPCLNLITLFVNRILLVEGLDFILVAQSDHLDVGLVWVNQTAGRCDVFCRLKLVSGQHPDFDFSPFHIFDSLDNACLQSVFKGCGTEQQQVALELRINVFKHLFS